MIKHIVFFKLTSKAETKKEQLKKMEEIFSPLGHKLNYIVEYKTGINFNKADFAWDFVIDSVFRSNEDLQKYQISDEHKEAVSKGSHIEKTKAVIDYEFIT
jgi:heme-degrading monooxygenase HmoA